MDTTIERGTYEIIQQRLQHQRQELVTRIQSLNKARQQIFGAVDFKLLSNVRISTDHNCVARDIVSVGNICILGYNVRLGLKTTLEISDVFSVYHFKEHEFHQAPLDIVSDSEFANELKNLYKFYRNTQFSRFSIHHNYLYFIFQLSESPADIKAFKWLIEGEKLIYMDSRSASEVRFPKQHEFTWTKATRDMQRIGKNPHISIAEKVFVETLGGDLTIKVEDNTDDGQGIYKEEVDQRDQSLDDAEIHYCDLGNLVLLKIRPYLEADRYFIFNHRIKKVIRVDTLKDAGILLPDDQGIILSNGYYLQTGENKLFDRKIEGVKFLRKIQSPNGEDFLFVFYEEKNHDFVILSYNVIEQTVKTPIFCNGYTLFDDGELCYFNTEVAPSKHHLIQIWQTPYSKELIPNETFKDHELYKIGNRPIVRAMAEIQELIVLLNKEDSYDGLYEDIQQKSQSITDGYFWLNQKGSASIHEPLQHIKEIAISAIDEFEKVVQIRKNTRENLEKSTVAVNKILFDTRSASYVTLEEYVSLLTQLRRLRGEIIGLKRLRYIDLEAVVKLEESIASRADKLADACVQFLLKEDALSYYQQRMDHLGAEVRKLTKVIDVKNLEKDFDELSHQLELLIDIVNNLKVEDTSHSTQIIENISVIFAQLNQQRVSLNNKRRQLGEREARADFSAQLTLLEQAIVNYLELANDPVKCDEYLIKLSIQLEELESRFVDYDEFIDKITEKREAVYAAFDSKKVSLIESRNRKTNSLFLTGQRILKSIQSRAATFESEVEINGYFASDLMIDKVRDSAKQLQQLDDAGKSEDLLNQLQVLQQEAIRALKDKKELFEDGNNIIKMGEFRFAVNNQKLDLTLVIRDKQYYYHLTGTSYYEAIDATAIHELQEVWEQELPSENREVSRAEYLAWQVFQELNPTNELPTDEFLIEKINGYMTGHYGEGYIKGVHDQDAMLLLQALIEKTKDLGLLRFPSKTRLLAKIFWHYVDADKKAYFKKQFVFVNLMRQVFDHGQEYTHLIQSLSQAIKEFSAQNKLMEHVDPLEAANYLAEEQVTEGFVLERSAKDLLEEFQKNLKNKNSVLVFSDAKKELSAYPLALWHLCKHWMQASASKSKVNIREEIVEEAASCLIMESAETHYVQQVSSQHEIKSVKSLGQHSDNGEGTYLFDYHGFSSRLKRFVGDIQPKYARLQTIKHQLIEKKKGELRLHEFQTQVLTSFVRNKLINQVYFPLIGANFAKQMGTYGADKRTDRSGMLLLVSPPGYGKTTLMEYVADRLGLIFMKINGPSIGHEITSVDPAEARNAATRQELQKLNLALEMGDNVMLYLDDIQHCNPEFLQKFISLADGQRKIEGVFNGQSKTYDFRGKRFCVVMAGNPYTESGDKFQIPDMLSNRADIYNLGDMVNNRADLFKLSLIENGLTSNPILKSLTHYGMDNLYKLVQYLENEDPNYPDLEGNLSSQEIQDCLSVLRKCMMIRDVVLQVNAQYIASAAMSDDYRVEPAFKLQGSYRDMNKLISQVVPILNDQEVLNLVLDHYRNESQTLTSDAESNLLKLYEMMNLLDETQTDRWVTIKETFVKNNRIRGFGDSDRMAQVIGQMSLFVEGLEGIKKALSKGRN